MDKKKAALQKMAGPLNKGTRNTPLTALEFYMIAPMGKDAGSYEDYIKNFHKTHKHEE